MKGSYLVLAGGVLISIYSAFMFLYGRKFAEKTRKAPVSEMATRLTWADTGREIREKCALYISEIQKETDRVAETPAAEARLQETLLSFQTALAQIQDKLSPLTFYKEVASEAEVRDASDACEKEADKAFVDLLAREDLYKVFKAIAVNTPPHTPVEEMLLKDTLKDFELNGLSLAPSLRLAFTTKKKKLLELQSDFSKTLNEWKETLAFSDEDLKGVPKDFLDSLKRDGSNYIVGLSTPHYTAVIENAEKTEVRKKIYTAFQVRGGAENRSRLQEALELRAEMARDLGRQDHATLQLEERMAKTPKAVADFLNDLVYRLQGLGEQERALLLELKQKDDPSAKRLEAWDIRYYENKLKKQKYDIDQQKLREYFPAKKVIEGMFQIYQTLLSVQFEPWTQAPLWHESVQAFQIIDRKTKELIAYFYMDLYPRENKFGHAAAFTLQSGFKGADGTYRRPVSAILANFTPARGELPALLTHSDVETLFHEFGHIMHQTLTRVDIPAYSGTRVKRDFVEAPSQMLENWVWNKETLKLMSGHYKTGEPLPDELIEKMISAKNMLSGVFYLRQAVLARVDLDFHRIRAGQGIDTTEIYKNLQEKISSIPFTPGLCLKLVSDT